ncbi:SPOR domain-containing protein [Salipiger bermudensis]|uniref:SPOR domain-containing protein n=1 Tax=Salipiger bermudensis TaxID=344736 RepID=UPI00300A70BD
MRLKTLAFLAITTAAAGAGLTPALAQGVTTIDTPAELPPASFTGTQYADSEGCVFVRAGYDGAVVWVPRVTRDRDQVCGYPPTFARSAPTATAAAPAPAPAPQPTAAPAPRPAAVAAAPAPTRTAPTRTTSARQPMATVASKPATPAPQRVVKAPASKPPSAPPPRTVVKTVPAPVATTSRLPRVATPSQLCPPGATGTVQSNGRTVRCGVQSSPFVTEVRRGEAPSAGKNVYYNYGNGQGSWDDSRSAPGADDPVALAQIAARPQSRIVPKHVWEARSEVPPVVPQGYRPAWEDDRLNRYRAWQTVDGYYATQRRWTNTVPRINDLTLRRIPARDPEIAYRDSEPAPLPAQIIATSGRTEAQARRTGVISSRSTPAAEAPARKASAAARYVEVGLFTTKAKADAAAARLRGAGLPVRYLRSGETRRVVVGPYSEGNALQTALRRVKGTGYVQAYLR